MRDGLNQMQDYFNGSVHGVMQELMNFQDAPVGMQKRSKREQNKLQKDIESLPPDLYMGVMQSLEAANGDN